MRSAPDKNGRENQNTSFYVQKLFSKNGAVCAIMWKKWYSHR
jgi:hypothetical protein